MVQRINMSHSILKSTVLFLLVVSGFQCKHHNEIAANVLTGKVVIFNGCGMSAIQVISGQIDPSRLMASWTDPDNDSVYHNVFSVGGTDIYCSLAGYGMVKGSLLQFELDPNPPALNCNMCNNSNPPSVPPISNAIKAVKPVAYPGDEIPAVFTGKLVIAGPCAGNVIQVKNGSVDTSMVTASWTDPSTNIVYKNVFTVSNYCTFAANGLSQGDSITFTFDGAPPSQTCARCTIYTPTPPAGNAVINVQKITSQ
jgi:hypothetical protein